MSILKIAISTSASRVGLIVAVALFAVPSFAFAWTIDAFDATIVVQEDASIQVEEVITVDFTEAKHGLFRNIPVSYKDGLGNAVRVHLSDVQVLQDGQPATVVNYRSGKDVVYQIGDGDVTLLGTHEYVFSYTVDRALLYFDTYDELYWNVTGDQWEVPITESSVFVLLPDGTEVLQSACYTGAFGSTATECGVATEDHVVAVVAEDYLTVAVGFEKGVVAQPTRFERIVWFLEANWFALIPLLIIIASFAAWWRLGRDPRMETVVAEFTPPEDLWAVYCGMIVRSMFTSADMAAMIVQLAVKGYLSFEVSGKGLARKVTLKKEQEATGLDEAHTVLFEHLFKGRTTVTATQLKGSASSKTMKELKTALNNTLKKNKMYVLHSKRRRTWMVGISVFLLYLTFFLGAFFGMFTGVMLFIAALVTFAFGLLMPKKTLHGVEVARNVLGFKLFMHTAQRYRSQWQEEQNMFATFLPYAIAFGDTKRWAKTFSGTEFQQPHWYRSTSGFVAADVFTKDLLSTTHSMARATAPSSSGSGGTSGGGFSGGGFGGGGGGSW